MYRQRGWELSQSGRLNSTDTSVLLFSVERRNTTVGDRMHSPEVGGYVPIYIVRRARFSIRHPASRRARNDGDRKSVVR